MKGGKEGRREENRKGKRKRKERGKKKKERKGERSKEGMGKKRQKHSPLSTASSRDSVPARGSSGS